MPRDALDSSRLGFERLLGRVQHTYVLRFVLEMHGQDAHRNRSQHAHHFLHPTALRAAPWRVAEKRIAAEQRQGCLVQRPRGGARA